MRHNSMIRTILFAAVLLSLLLICAAASAIGYSDVTIMYPEDGSTINAGDIDVFATYSRDAAGEKIDVTLYKDAMRSFRNVSTRRI